MLMLVLALVGLVLCALAGSVIASLRGGDPMAGFIVGMVLGPLGLLIACCLCADKPARRQSPDADGQAVIGR